MNTNPKVVELIPYDPSQDDNQKQISPQNDIELAKDNIKEIINSLTPAFLDLVDVARQAQNDKYYTALSTLAKTMIDANKELINVSKTDKEIEKLSIDNENKKNQGEDNLTQVNQLYVSSEEILNQIIEKLGNSKDRVEETMRTRLKNKEKDKDKNNG